MASLERINLQLKVPVVDGGKLEWSPSKREPMLALPQIVWSDGRPWREANLWAFDCASDTKRSLKTVLSSMTHIHAYAKWLEQEGVNWWDFPVREMDRCLVRFRGALIEARDDGLIAPSTTSQRMAAVIRFYRWLVGRGMLSTDWPLWNEVSVGIRLTDGFGLKRTMKVSTSDLAIANRARPGNRLEDGLTPVSSTDVSKIMQVVEQHGSTEMHLMLRIGFGSGMRFGTISDLKVQTISRAVRDPNFLGYYRISVGPGARPPVNTKFGITGQIWIHENEMDAIKDYIYSTRRLARQSLAIEQDRDLVFFNRFGNRYASDGIGVSRGISVELGRLRKKGVSAGISAMRTFKFHQSRCTFATELARVALKHGNTGIAVDLVKQALLHQDEKTTLGYIKFIEDSKVMAQAADEFTRKFLGIFSDNPNGTA